MDFECTFSMERAIYKWIPTICKYYICNNIPIMFHINFPNLVNGTRMGLGWRDVLKSVKKTKRLTFSSMKPIVFNISLWKLIECSQTYNKTDLKLVLIYIISFWNESKSARSSLVCDLALRRKGSWHTDSRKIWFVSSRQMDIISFTIIHISYIML